MKINYTNWSPHTAAHTQFLEDTIGVIEEYTQAGYLLTVRQLYYQLVSRGIVENGIKPYRRVVELTKNARLGGWVDWLAIADRSRDLISPPEFEGPEDLFRSAVEGFRLERWAGQENYLEVWCEKDALSSVLAPVAMDFHVPFLANRGFNSVSAMYDAAGRFIRASVHKDQQPVILYLGDHDPSGMDMSRDIKARLELLTDGLEIDIVRLALNIDQVEEYQPKENPVKFSDSRAHTYVQAFGERAWELDALPPGVLNDLLGNAILERMDFDAYEARLEEEEAMKEQMRHFLDTYGDFNPNEE